MTQTGALTAVEKAARDILDQGYAVVKLSDVDAGNLHTAIDTSGFLGNRASDEFLDLVDLTLLDSNSGDAGTYHLGTSADLGPGA